MKKIICVLLVLSMLTLCACGNAHVSSYKAVSFSHSSMGGSFQSKFGSLDGRFVAKIHNDEGDGTLSYEGKLTKGEMDVYYEWNGVKTLLVHLKEGEEVSSLGGYVGNGTIYITLETTEKCSGSVRVSVAEESA